MRNPFLVLIALLCFAGCSEQGPKLVEVQGTVTLNNEPVVSALVSFQPDDPAASPSYGETDESGHYQLQFSPQRSGAMIGIHTVTITTENENLHQRETMPKEYRDGRGVKREVINDKNVIDFSIETE